MDTATCIMLGYLLGSINPAALLSKLKNVNFRNQGTGNLGASNTLLLLGKGYGALVMAFDIFKAWFSAKLARTLFPQLVLAGLIASAAAVVGHVFPFYLKFHGGKGLAAFGGMVLAYNPPIFLFLLILCIVLMLIVNYSWVMPITAGFLFPILAAFHSRDLVVTLICTAASVLILVKHWSNIDKARRGDEIKIRDFIQGKH